MNKEQYVTFEVAKLLKDKGFDWDCEHYYKPNGEIVRTFHTNGSHNINSSVLYEHQCLAPTQQMALRWLKETNGLWIVPMPCENGDCYFEIYKRYGKIWKNNVYDHTDYENFDEPENAIEAALEFVLTKLI